MRFAIRLLFCLFVSVSAYAQDSTVVKKVFASPGPNLFYVSPSLALNEKNRVTQVVWERHPGNHPDHSTLIRKITPKGAPKGSQRTLISGTNTYNPTLLYNRNKNEFAIVFADEFQNPVHTIFIQRLNSKGQILGAPVQISTDTGQSFVNQHPFAAFDPVTSRYVIVWARNSTTFGTTIAGEGIHAAVLDANLATIAGPVLILPEDAVFGNPQVRNVAVLSSGKTVVAFTQTVGTDPLRSHYKVAAFDLDLNNLKIKKLLNRAIEDLRLDAVFASLSSTSTYVYFVDSNRIRKRAIDPLGRPVGATSNAFASPLGSQNLFVPRFAGTPQSGGATRGLLVAIEDPSQILGNGKIWIQRIDGKGEPVGSPEAVDSGFIAASQLEILTLPSSRPGRLKFSAVYVNGSQITVPPQGEFSELIHLNLTVPAQ